MSTAIDPVWLPNPDIKIFGTKILAAHQKTIAGIIETGTLLIEAKEKLAHGDFLEMLRMECRWSPRTAQRFMKIAANPSIQKRHNVSHLPTSIRALGELVRFEPSEFDHATSNRWIKPEMTSEDVKRLYRRTQVALGTRRRSPPRMATTQKPRTFAARLRTVLNEDDLEWLGGVDDQVVRKVAEYVRQLRSDREPK